MIGLRDTKNFLVAWSLLKNPFRAIREASSPVLGEERGKDVRGFRNFISSDGCSGVLHHGSAHPGRG